MMVPNTQTDRAMCMKKVAVPFPDGYKGRGKLRGTQAYRSGHMMVLGQLDGYDNIVIITV